MLINPINSRSLVVADIPPLPHVIGSSSARAGSHVLRVYLRRCRCRAAGGGGAGRRWVSDPPTHRPTDRPGGWAAPAASSGGVRAWGRCHGAGGGAGGVVSLRGSVRRRCPGARRLTGNGRVRSRVLGETGRERAEPPRLPPAAGVGGEPLTPASALTRSPS